MKRDLERSVPDPVRTTVTALVERSQGVFGSRLTAIYLHGSIALEDFDPATSDVDFVTVLDGQDPMHETGMRGGRGASPNARATPLAGVEPGSSRHSGGPHDLALIRRDLRRLHRDLADEFPQARKLEGVYLSSEDLLGGDGSVRYPYVKRGRVRGGARLPVVARSLLRERGVVLFGPDPRYLVPPVPRAVLDTEMHENLSVYWASRAARPWLFLFDSMVDFAVLTLPRILHTLETGEIISKRAAAPWLEARFPEWRSLVADARGRFYPSRSSVGLRGRLPRALATRRFVLAMIERGEGRRAGGRVRASSPGL